MLIPLIIIIANFGPPITINLLVDGFQMHCLGGLPYKTLNITKPKLIIKMDKFCYKNMEFRP